MRSAVRREWASLSRRAMERFPALRGLRLVRCREADAEHRASWRQFCHVGHLGPKTVCYAAAMTRELPPEYVRGILAHEIGHALGFARGDFEHTEEDADRLGEEACQVRIDRREMNLEWSPLRS